MRTRLQKWPVIFAALCTLPLSLSASAQWTLDNSLSRLSFVSVKSTDIGEVHKFTQLKGQFDADGKLEVKVDLFSVDTLIPIRTERVKQYLFNVEQYPIAVIRANLDAGALRELAFGQVKFIDVAGTLTLKENTIEFTTEVLASKVGDDTLFVTTAQPIMMTATALGLSEGIDKLRELAGLPSISQAVPITFALTFRQNDQ